MRLLTVDGHRWPGGADIRITAAGRWLRVGMSWSSAPGSRMAGKHATAWLTVVDDLRGANARVGRWPSPCLTLWAHTRPASSSTDRPRRAIGRWVERTVEDFRDGLVRGFDKLWYG